VITSATILEILYEYCLLANAAIVLSYDYSNCHQFAPSVHLHFSRKIRNPQLAIPKERTAKTIAMTKPTKLIVNSLDVVTASLAVWR
jgi:hypothetical protein